MKKKKPLTQKEIEAFDQIVLLPEERKALKMLERDGEWYIFDPSVSMTLQHFGFIRPAGRVNHCGEIRFPGLSVLTPHGKRYLDYMKAKRLSFLKKESLMPAIVAAVVTVVFHLVSSLFLS